VVPHALTAVDDGSEPHPAGTGTGRVTPDVPLAADPTSPQSEPSRVHRVMIVGA